jgi:hypothetical protein
MYYVLQQMYWDADKFLARPGRKESYSDQTSRDE